MGAAPLPIHGAERSLMSSTPATMRHVPFAPLSTVRVGLVGCGSRGTMLLRDLLEVDGVQITALLDTRTERTDKATAFVTAKGQPAPVAYHAPSDVQALCERADVDLVYVASPWERHTPQAVTAMQAGKHVAVEVPAAVTLDECWQLVETSEQTGRHCIMLENCCYEYNELLVLQMVQAGVFGTLTYAEAAYIHDLRELLFDGYVEGPWRRQAHRDRNGNLYPTHGLGPVARYLDIHRGDRFTQIVSMSSREASLSEWRDAHLPPNDARRSETYRCGDINTSLLRTELGRTVLLQHDTVTPRPYTRLNTVSGTKGMFTDFPARVFLDSDHNGKHVTGGDPDAWRPLTDFRQYEHPLWTRLGDKARKMGGHGGCDFVMNWRLIQCVQEGLPPDMDVYDAAAWSAPGPLSEQSVAGGSVPVAFPDFTRGNWQ